MAAQSVLCSPVYYICSVYLYLVQLIPAPYNNGYLPCLQKAGASMHLLILLPYSCRLIALFMSLGTCLLDADAATCIARPCLTEFHVSTPHHFKRKCIACLCPAKCTRLPSQHAFQWWKFVSAWRLACRYEQMLGSAMLEVKKLRTIQRAEICMDTAHKDRKF